MKNHCTWIYNGMETWETSAIHTERDRDKVERSANVNSERKLEPKRN